MMPVYNHNQIGPFNESKPISNYMISSTYVTPLDYIYASQLMTTLGYASANTAIFLRVRIDIPMSFRPTPLDPGQSYESPRTRNKLWKRGKKMPRNIGKYIYLEW